MHLDCFVQILKGIEEIREHQRAGQHGEAAPVPAHHMINGQNAMLWPARTGRKFCLDLMTAMFKKTEMGDRLAIISQTARKRTKKSTLPADKVCNKSLSSQSYLYSLPINFAD